MVINKAIRRNFIYSKHLSRFLTGVFYCNLHLDEIIQDFNLIYSVNQTCFEVLRIVLDKFSRVRD